MHWTCCLTSRSPLKLSILLCRCVLAAMPFQFAAVVCILDFIEARDVDKLLNCSLGMQLPGLSKAMQVKHAGSLQDPSVVAAVSLRYHTVNRITAPTSAQTGCPRCARCVVIGRCHLCSDCRLVYADVCSFDHCTRCKGGRWHPDDVEVFTRLDHPGL